MLKGMTLVKLNITSCQQHFSKHYCNNVIIIMAKIPSLMKGLCIQAYGKPYLYKTDLPVPQPNNDEMLVKVKIAGFCHTETIVLEGDYEGKLPMIPGHESVGTVVVVGSNVQGFQIGDRVGVGLFHGSCGKCRECSRGSSNFCPQVQLSGLNSDGGMAEYLLADPSSTIKLPDGLSFKDATPMMCAGNTMFNSIRRSQQPPGSVLAVVGVGGLGHLGVQFAKAMGYKCVAIDTRQDPLDLVASSNWPPDLLINPKDGVDNAIEKIKNTFHKHAGIDTAIVCTDAIPAFKYTTDILEKHGTLIAVGQPKDPIPFHWSVFVAKDITVLPGGLGDKKVLQEMMELVMEKNIRAQTRLYPLDQIARLVDDFHDARMKGKLLLQVE
ncbi:chaperonin 10-like protein [Bisporella sp. PMI_857]|nr:chaperonin 10-like protein [Bisporella sp. PMI_857]